MRFAQNRPVVVSDLDGTFLNTERSIPDKNMKLLKDLHLAGVPFIPATGRPFVAIPEEIFSVGRAPFAITANGAAITDMETGKVVYSRYLDRQRALNLYERIKDLGATFDIFANGTVYTQRSQWESIAHFPISKEHIKLMQEIREPLDMTIPEIIDFTGEVRRVTVICDTKTKMEQIRAIVEADPSLVCVSSGMNDLEISDVGANKGASIQWLMNHMHGLMKDVIAFGDSENDITMLQAAGTGIAMKNGMPAAKDAANMITTCSNDQAGVAHFLDTWLV